MASAAYAKQTLALVARLWSTARIAHRSVSLEFVQYIKINLTISYLLVT